MIPGHCLKRCEPVYYVFSTNSDRFGGVMHEKEILPDRNGYVVKFYDFNIYGADCFSLKELESIFSEACWCKDGSLMATISTGRLNNAEVVSEEEFYKNVYVDKPNLLTRMIRYFKSL